MAQVSDRIIEEVREGSRQLVRELGFMRAHLASTHLAPSALHTLLEIDLKGPQTAAMLCSKLGLEKSSVSRMLKKLIDSGELYECVYKADARVKQLHLTEQGHRTVNVAHEYAREKTQSALSRLSPEKQNIVLDGLSAYASALHSESHSPIVSKNTNIRIVEG